MWNYLSPLTGEADKTWIFYVLGAVVLVAVVLALLPLFGKKKDDDDPEKK